ncbi:MAG: hypothetical protein QOF01_327 [Thermomicrobiales bacterium]|nr:hypothetical protein [Thermomicrobiales bacterium]
MYFHPASPLISFRYPEGGQPETIQSGLVGVTLYSPRRDALFGLGTGQFQQEVTLETLLSLAFDAIFTNDLRQEVGQQLCAVQFPPPIPTATSVFTAAQYATSIVAIAVTVTYEQGTTISTDSNLVPTIYTTLVYNTFAGPIDQFPSLVEQAFFPILRQLTYWPFRSTEDPDDNGDDDGGDDGGGG